MLVLVLMMLLIAYHLDWTLSCVNAGNTNISLTSYVSFNSTFRTWTFLYSRGGLVLWYIFASSKRGATGH